MTIRRTRGEPAESHSDMEEEIPERGAGKKPPGIGASAGGRKRRRESKGKTCRKILKATLKEFGETTTFHGLRYVTNDSYHTLRRFVWLLVVLAMVSWLSFDVIGAVVLMLQYPERSSISVRYPSSVTFPAVTLCNINMLRADALTPSQRELLSSVFTAHPAGRSREPPGEGLFPSSSDNDSQLLADLVDASYRIEDMLLRCLWSGVRCSSANFTRRLTDHGVCYTFNEPSRSPGGGGGGGGGGPLVVRQPGSRNGLFLRLNVQQYLYTNGESSAAGVKVLLHAQGEYPMIKEFAFSLSPGFETSVVVRQKVIESLKAPYRSNCTDGFRKKYPFSYSAASCQFACKVDYVVQKCGCRDYRWPGSAPICSLEKQVNCIYSNEDEFLATVGPCNCPIACQTIKYDRGMSTAYWPASYLSRELQRSLNITEEFIRKNYLDVYIYFEEIAYTTIVQTGAYTFSNLQSDIGGYLGLLCGMSLMTLVELADVLLVALVKKLKR